MKATKKIIALIMALAMVCAMAFTVFAEPASDGDSAATEAAEPAGESEGESAAEAAEGDSAEAAAEAITGQVITETLTFEDGVTLEEGNLYIAEDGYCVIMTVDGQVLTQAPGTYEGKVVFEVVPMTESADETTSYQTQSIITKTGEDLFVAESAVAGEFDAQGVKNADITADQASMSIVTVATGEYEIADSTFHILQTGNHESGGNDFTGEGCAIAATGDTVLYVNGVDVVGDGVTRTCLFGGLSTRYAYPTVYVSDCNFTSTGDAEGEDCAVWVLGLHGVVRTCQFCDYYDIYYNNTVIKSFGWACLSVDGTEYPYEEDLAELSAAYVEGEGYANADGEIMELNEFAVAALGLTDEYLAQLAAVETAEDLAALPQTNDWSLYYFPGKNTLTNCELSILDMEEGRTGYSSYSIGANINVYSNCLVNADYGNVEANEYASSAYVNGTVVNARKSIVMCHSNAGGITFCSDATLNADEIAFIYKGTGEGYTQDQLTAEGESAGGMTMGATGSNLYVRNCVINTPVIVLTFDSDDPGSLGGTQIQFDDSIAGKDEAFDVTNADNWGPASTMWASGVGYNYNEAVEAYFEDCNGETALVGDIFNCHQYTSKNLVLTLDNTEITGIISSGWCEHDVEGVDRSLAYGDETIVGEDGLTYGCRENLGRVSCYQAPTVNNGVIVTLKNGSVWNVTETSYVSVLDVDETSTVNGVVTELENGLFMVEPAEGAAAAGEGVVTVTFSTGETAEAIVGQPFEFFFQCDAPGDMGAPADGEEGAGITVSSGTVAYSNVGLGGPNSYPTSELVTVTDFDGDFTVTVCDDASAMDATHTIYFTAEEIEAAIASAEAMAAQMAENPMDEGGSEGGEGESAEGESAEEAAPAAGDTSEDAYKAYLKEYTSAIPAVQDNIEDFYAAIDAGDYTVFPADMLFTDSYFGFAAMSYDEFVAAGGAYEIPAFDPNLAAD